MDKLDDQPDTNLAVEMGLALGVVARSGHSSKEHDLVNVPFVRTRTIWNRFHERQVVRRRCTVHAKPFLINMNNIVLELV